MQGIYSLGVTPSGTAPRVASSFVTEEGGVQCWDGRNLHNSSAGLFSCEETCCSKYGGALRPLAGSQGQPSLNAAVTARWNAGGDGSRGDCYDDTRAESYFASYAGGLPDPSR
jgi:hypothetical protein